MKQLVIIIFILAVGVTNLKAQSYSNYKITPTSVKVKKSKTSKENSLDSRKVQSKIEYLKNLDDYRKKNNVPEDFPKFIDTGNPKKDLDNYYKAKQEWIRKNPERFEKIKHLNL